MKINKHLHGFFFLTFRSKFVTLQANSTVFKSGSLYIEKGEPQGICISSALLTNLNGDSRGESDKKLQN